MASPVASCRSNNSPSNCTASGSRCNDKHKSTVICRTVSFPGSSARVWRNSSRASAALPFCSSFSPRSTRLAISCRSARFRVSAMGKVSAPEAPQNGVGDSAELRGVVQLKILGSLERASNAVPDSAITKVTTAPGLPPNNYSSKRLQRFPMFLPCPAKLSLRRPRSVPPGPAILRS